MEDRRIETAPALLAALATAALGLSWTLAHNGADPVARRATEPPARTQGPIRWPLAMLPPLATPTLRIAEPELSVDAEVPSPSPLRIVLATPPACDHLATLSATDLLALSPLRLAPPKADDEHVVQVRRIETKITRVDYRGRLVLLTPAEPRWRAGDQTTRVVSHRMRRDWSVGGVDTVELARTAGRLLSGRVPALAKTSTESWFASMSAPTRRFELPGPRLVAARGVLPAPTSRRNASVTPRSLPTIADYLAVVRAVDFPTPHALAEQLDRVAGHRDLAPWAWATAYRLRTLATTPATSERAVEATFATLAEAASEARAEAAKLGDGQAATELRRAAYAIDRRLATWRPGHERVVVLARRGNPSTLSPAERLAAARWAMNADPGTAARGLAIDTAPLRIAARLERYEDRPTARLAQTIASQATEFAASDDPQAAAIARAIEENYRNANVRVAVAAELIERMLPQPEPQTAPVRDRIAGTMVSGRSTTESSLRVLLSPDESAWRIGLEAEGLVTAKTSSRGGPARLVSQGATRFQAKKLVVISRDALDSTPAVATAQSASPRLVGLSTQYDRVPLVRSYVRSTARSEYARLSSRARVETQAKVEQRVRNEFDQRTEQQLDSLNDRYQDAVVSRLARLGLQVEPVEMRTTDVRLISRLRVANSQQLAAHTPRMRAPSDSLLSVQLHESMLNNALEGLDLAGARLTPEQLRQRMQEKLGIVTEENPQQVRALLGFSSVEPARFTLADGRAELTLSFAELSVARRRHRNFKVHAFYRPEVTGLTAALVQDGTPHIEGRLRSASRMHLHGVLGKVLAKTERIPLVGIQADTPDRVAAALVGLATNQFVIEDGWLGLAIGPQRPTNRVALQVGHYVR